MPPAELPFSASVERCFSRSAQAYQRWATLQAAVAHRLAQLIPPIPAGPRAGLGAGVREWLQSQEGGLASQLLNRALAEERRKDLQEFAGQLVENRPGEENPPRPPGPPPRSPPGSSALWMHPPL